ncbi:MAG: ATP-binding protein [Parasphingorhabdus sp.]|nr:ATP-binding protein [Parasphingorhabdus sp.]
MAQTFVLYLILLLPAIWLVRRVSRPLRALTLAARDFDPINSESLKPTGPQDTRDLTNAFNAMQQRVSQMLTEKDVMLGAIGHDLRTPLAVLRVRVENVEDAQERAAMAATIAELDASLSDILTFARLGRSAEGRENTDIGALVDTLIDEYGAPDGVISRAESQRMVAPVRALLIKRALRNLIGNALTYGGSARITLAGHADALDIMIDDDGPGVADVDIARLFEPFARGEKSRNRATGGSGLGLTIARAIARSHGGDVTLANRPEGGLRATLRLPLSSTSQA